MPRDLVCLMSALRTGEEPGQDSAAVRTFTFKQEVPMPSYLIAIAVGALESRYGTYFHSLTQWKTMNIVPSINFVLSYKTQDVVVRREGVVFDWYDVTCSI